MIRTPNLNIPKLELSDKFDITVVNEAYDTLDQALGNAQAINAPIELGVARGSFVNLGDRLNDSDDKLSDIIQVIVKPTGTDDTANLQSAINSLTSGGTLICQPNKNYYIQSPLTITNDNIVIDFRGSALKAGVGFPSITGSHINMINVDGFNNFDIKNTKFDMGTSSYLVNGEASGACVSIYSFDSAEGNPDLVTRKVNFEITNCEFNNCHKGVQALNDIENVKISKCKFINYYSTGVDFDMAYPLGVEKHYPKGLKLDKCYFKSVNSNFGAIYLSGAQECEVFNNYIEDNKLAVRVYVNDLGYYVRDIEIHSNKIKIVNSNVALIEAGIKIMGMSYNSLRFSQDYTAERIDIHHNKIFSDTDFTNQKVTIIDAISMCMVRGFSVHHNKIKNFPRAISVGDVYSGTRKRVSHGTITDNIVYNSSLAPIAIVDVLSVSFARNTFINWNKSASTATEKIGIDLRMQKNVDFDGDKFITDDGLDALRTSCFNVTQGHNIRMFNIQKSSTLALSNRSSKDTKVIDENNSFKPFRIVYSSRNPYGTFKINDRNIMSAPYLYSSTNYLEQVCIAEGTSKPATTATATGTTGTNTVTLSAPTDFNIGDLITITGVTGYREITDIDFNTNIATLLTNLDATVNGASIGWQAMTLKYCNPYAV